MDVSKEVTRLRHAQKTLEKLGILPDAIENAGKASKILDRLDKRRREGLTTPKQIRFLESRGFQHVGTWQFETAKNMIDRIAGNGWRVPSGIIPAEYEILLEDALKQQFVDSECLRYMNPLTPRRTGFLIKSGTLGTVIGSGSIEYLAPYARRQYYENKSKPRWFETMKASHKEPILKGAERIARE